MVLLLAYDAMVHLYGPNSFKPWCSAKSSKSLRLSVANGRSQARQQTAIQMVSTGRARPRRIAAADRSPQNAAIALLPGITGLLDSQSHPCWIRPRRLRQGKPRQIGDDATEPWPPTLLACREAEPVRGDWPQEY